MISEYRDHVADFSIIRPRLEEFAGRLSVLMLQLLRAESIGHHALEFRAKTIESFMEKSSRSGKEYSEPLTDITDLVGMRVILNYAEDVNRVCEIIKREFYVIDRLSVDKRAELRPDQFGYISVHLVSELSKSRSTLTEWVNFSGIKFEVQVRTVLQHAWASISHALQYKQESDVPDKFKRRLGRLAGLLEIADEEFSQLREQRELHAKEIAEKVRRNDKVPLSNPDLMQHLMQSQAAKFIADRARLVGLGVSQKVHPKQIYAACLLLKIGDIASLERALEKCKSKAEKFFVEFKLTRDHAVSGDVGHWCAVILFASHVLIFSEEQKTKVILGSEEYQADVVKIAQNVFVD